MMDSAAATCGALPALGAKPGASLLVGARANDAVVRCLPGSAAAVFQGAVRFNRARRFVLGRAWRSLPTASADPNKCQMKSVSAPLQPVSPAGRFLCGILNDHPHVFSVAATEQLEDLALEREAAIARRDRNLGSSESHLHERIAAVKQKECQIAVEEVMYMLIFHRFSQINVPMVPRLTTLMGQIFEIWPSKDKELESVHSDEVLQMVKDHLLNVLKRCGTPDATVEQSKIQIKRLQLGRIYAASIMYGYFVKSVCLRHHLEFTFALTSKDYPLSYLVQMPSTKFVQEKSDQSSFDMAYPTYAAASMYSTLRARKVKRLRNYLMGFNSTTLQICAKLKSQEAANLIEKHSRALFLDHDGANLEDDMETVTYPGMKRLVLEAVAFGTFLWDAERYVDSVYRLQER